MLKGLTSLGIIVTVIWDNWALSLIGGIVLSSLAAYCFRNGLWWVAIPLSAIVAVIAIALFVLAVLGIVYFFGDDKIQHPDWE
jgi:hypothetical protein